jgi:hypothetical protein
VTAPEIAVEVDQNPYLAPGATRIDAVVTLTATGVAAAPADALEIVIVDCSGSMAGRKIVSARQATAAALAEVRDGASFAVIAGNHSAHQVYPPTGTARAYARTRAEAARAVQGLRADGATAIGAWLRLARRIADAHPNTVRHAILLTDGQNGERADVFERAVQGCVGAFVCDCRGVGTDWRVEELRTVASALLGTVDIVARPEDLAADFRALTGAAMAKNVPDLWLRLWTPQGAVVRFVKQVAPAVEDLTGRRVDAGRQRGAYPLGAWGAESRDYHLCVEVAHGATGAHHSRTRGASAEFTEYRNYRQGDDPRRIDWPLELTADWTFIRFHYGTRGRRGNYSESEMGEWADKIAGLRERADVWAYFNNDWEAFAVHNGLRLRRLVEGGA